MNLSRRCILGKILTGLFLLKFPGHLSSGSILNQESEQKIRLGYTSFIKELQKSKNLLLQKKLKELILQREFGKGFDFHLRNAGLDFKEVQIISNAMMKATKHGILNLKSFSLSYNPEITDQGVVLLVKAFPPQITELGLVGCDLGDEAGEGIYQYLENSALELVCIEGNNFSPVLMDKFKKLREQKSNLSLII